MSKKKAKWTRKVKAKKTAKAKAPEPVVMTKEMAEGLAQIQRDSNALFDHLFGKNEELDRQMAESYDACMRALLNPPKTAA